MIFLLCGVTVSQDSCLAFKGFWFELVDAKGHTLFDWQEVLTRQSQYPNVNAGNPSILKPVSNDFTSASLLLCDTAVCFLRAHEVGTKT